MVVAKSAVTKGAALTQLGASDGKAQVTEEKTITKRYVEDKPTDTAQDRASNDSDSDTERANNRESQAPIFQDSQTPRNRLAEMFEDLREAQDYAGEMFVVLITRRQDLMTDNFRKPCMQSTSFAPLQITSDYFLQFVPLIQKYNANSGGRFDIVICSSDGKDLDIGIANLVISDPLQDEKPVTESKNELDILTLVREMNEANDRRFAELITVMRKPDKPDEFMELAKEKMRNDFLNPPEKKGFNPEETIAQVMTSVAVTQAMGDGFARMFNRDSGSEKDGGLLEKLLTNEMVIDRASGVLQNALNIFGAMAQARNNPTAPPIYAQPQPTGYPPLPQQPPQAQPEQAPTEPTEIDMETQEIINALCKELESDRPLDETNEVLKDIKEQHTPIYNQLTLICKMVSFETLVEQLGEHVPDIFDRYYDDNDEANELGEKVLGRLETFYKQMKEIDITKVVS
jgi:hypothetical protein